MTAADPDQLDLPGAIEAIRHVIDEARTAPIAEVQAGIRRCRTIASYWAACADDLAEVLRERSDT